jgi:hypothetical protein
MEISIEADKITIALQVEEALLCGCDRLFQLPLKKDQKTISANGKVSPNALCNIQQNIYCSRYSFLNFS